MKISGFCLHKLNDRVWFFEERSQISTQVNWGGGGKAMTITMIPWNLTHGLWSKNLTMATDILESAPWLMVKMVILLSSLVVKSKVYHFDHRKFAFGHHHGLNG